MEHWTEDDIRASRAQFQKQLKAWCWLLVTITLFGWLVN